MTSIWRNAEQQRIIIPVYQFIYVNILYVSIGISCTYIYFLVLFCIISGLLLYLLLQICTFWPRSIPITSVIYTCWSFSIPPSLYTCWSCSIPLSLYTCWSCSIPSSLYTYWSCSIPFASHIYLLVLFVQPFLIRVTESIFLVSSLFKRATTWISFWRYCLYLFSKIVDFTLQRRKSGEMQLKQDRSYIL